MNIHELRSFRLLCKEKDRVLVETLLKAQGFLFIEEDFSPFVRRLVHEPFPLGSSLAAKFGYIYIQDASSMLPPLALAPQKGACVLDMCASPGSKTGFLAQLVGDNGFVLGNEPSQNRLATLRHNLINMNLLHTGTTSYSAELFPLLSAPSILSTPTHNGWSHILLDPPCSGWGTVEKNPHILNLWQGDKVKPLIALQRALLTRATALLKKGGRVVYSTCTTNIQENEEQINFAVNELGLRLLSLIPPAGFTIDNTGMTGTLNLPTGQKQQGFFVALLEKTENLPESVVKGSAENLAEDSPAQGKSSPAQNIPPLNSTKTTPHRSLTDKYVKEPIYIDSTLLNEAGYDAQKLPAGKLAVFNQTVYFLPKAAQALPQGLKWKAYPLGKEHNGNVRFSPSLRALMPDHTHDSPNLHLDDLAPLEQLITGQSINTTTKSKYVNLYFKGLPLCRLLVKGKRLMLPAL